MSRKIHLCNNKEISQCSARPIRQTAGARYLTEFNATPKEHRCKRCQVVADRWNELRIHGDRTPIITPDNITWEKLISMQKMRDQKLYPQIRQLMGYQGTDAEVLQKLNTFIHEETRSH